MAVKRSELQLGEILSGEHAGQTMGFSLDLVRSGRLLLQASSGGGKSETIRKIATLTIPHIPNWIVDPEGEYSALRAQLPFLLVGPGGEVPATLETVDEVVRLLLETGVSAIFDLFELGTAKYEYARKLFTALDEAPKKLWRELLVTVDEAHVLAPQDPKIQRVSSEAFANLASRGRKRGVAIVVATQRLALLDNNVAALCENMLFGRTGLIDQPRIAKMLGFTGKAGNDFMRQIGRVNDGDFYAYGRAFGVLDPTLFHVERVPGQTLAKTSTSKQRTAPPTPQSIVKLLPKFEALPKQVEEKAKTDRELRKDLADAQKRVAELERAATRPSPMVTSPRDITDREKTAIVRPFIQERLRIGRQLDALVKTVRGEIEDLIGLESDLKDTRSLVLANLPDDAAVLNIQTSERLGVQTPKRPDAQTPMRPVVHAVPATEPAANPEVKLRGRSFEMLRVCARMYPKGLTEAQVASQTGMKRTGGTWGDYKSLLRTSGSIRIEGGLWFATEEGMRRAGTDIPAAPKTTEDVLAMWLPKMRGKAKDMLKLLVAKGGEPMSREELGETVGVATSGGTFGDYLSLLRTADLVITDASGVRANAETLLL